MTVVLGLVITVIGCASVPSLPPLPPPLPQVRPATIEPFAGTWSGRYVERLPLTKEVIDIVEVIVFIEPVSEERASMKVWNATRASEHPWRALTVQLRAGELVSHFSVTRLHGADRLEGEQGWWSWSLRREDRARAEARIETMRREAAEIRRKEEEKARRTRCRFLCGPPVGGIPATP